MSALGGKTLNNDIFGLWVAAFMVGCAAYLTLSVDLAVPPAGLIALLGVIWLTQRWNWVVMFLLLISGVLAGLVWTDTQSQINATAVHQLSLGPLDVWGRVDHMERKGQKVRYVLSDLQYDPPLTTPYPKKIRISAPVSANSPIRVGDDIWLRAKLNPLPPPVYPDGFDFARNLYFKSIGAIGYSYSPAELDKSRTDLRWSDHISRLRSLIGQRIDVSLDGQVAAIAKALLIGERSEIDDDRYEQIRRSGLAHIMAISGLHMGMVTGLIFLFVKFLILRLEPLALRISAKKVAAFTAILGGGAYLLLSGASTSTLRAFVMASVVLTAIILDRAPFSFRSVAVAALIVLIINPTNVVSAGFQMSFSAVIGLIYVYRHYDPVRAWIGERFSSKIARPINWLLALIVTTLVASVTVAPISAYHFQEIHMGGLASNLLVIPLMAFWVMPMGMLAVLLMPLGLESVPLALMGQGVEVFLDISAAFSDNSLGHWKTGFVPVLSLVLYSGVLMSLMLLRKWAQWLSAPILLFFTLIVARAGEPPEVIISTNKAVVVHLNKEGEYVSTSHRAARFEQKSWAKMLAVDDFGRSETKDVCIKDACEIRVFDKAGAEWQVTWRAQRIERFGTVTFDLDDLLSRKSSRVVRAKEPSFVSADVLWVERLNTGE